MSCSCWCIKPPLNSVIAVRMYLYSDEVGRLELESNATGSSHYVEETVEVDSHPPRDNDTRQTICGLSLRKMWAMSSVWQSYDRPVLSNKKICTACKAIAEVLEDPHNVLRVGHPQY